MKRDKAVIASITIQQSPIPEEVTSSPEFLADFEESVEELRLHLEDMLLTAARRAKALGDRVRVPDIRVTSHWTMADYVPENAERKPSA